MGPYTRRIYDRIMQPMVARGEVEVWHHVQRTTVPTYAVRRPMLGVRP